MSAPSLPRSPPLLPRDECECDPIQRCHCEHDIGDFEPLPSALTTAAAVAPPHVRVGVAWPPSLPMATKPRQHPTHLATAAAHGVCAPRCTCAGAEPELSQARCSCEGAARDAVDAPQGVAAADTVLHQAHAAGPGDPGRTALARAHAPTAATGLPALALAAGVGAAAAATAASDAAVGNGVGVMGARTLPGAGAAASPAGTAIAAPASTTAAAAAASAAAAAAAAATAATEPAAAASASSSSAAAERPAAATAAAVVPPVAAPPDGGILLSSGRLDVGGGGAFTYAVPATHSSGGGSASMPGRFERVDIFGQTRCYFTMEEVARHNQPEDCWLVAHGRVYDVTSFLKRHPAGEFAILRHGGTDSSTDFDFHSSRAQRLWAPFLLGHVAPKQRSSDCVVS